MTPLVAEDRGRGLQVIKWISGYQETLANLGVPEEDTVFPQEKQSGLKLLMQKYIERMQATRKTWFTNILEVGVPPSMGSMLSWVAKKNACLHLYLSSA